MCAWYNGFFTIEDGKGVFFFCLPSELLGGEVGNLWVHVDTMLGRRTGAATAAMGQSPSANTKIPEQIKKEKEELLTVNSSRDFQPK